jgi:CheY-like chemotaxis protein
MDLATERGRFVQLLAGEVYDVILADYRLPGLDARSARELARVASPETPFVGLAAMVSEEISAQLMDGGAMQCALEARMTRLPFVVRRALRLRADACGGLSAATTAAPPA